MLTLEDERLAGYGMSRNRTVLEYAGAEPRRQKLARRLRLVVLIIGLLAFGTGLAWLFNPVLGQVGDEYGLVAGLMGTPAVIVPGDHGPWGDKEDNQRMYSLDAMLYLGIFLLTQYLFLMPRGSWRIRLAAEGRPLKRAAIAAGLIGMLISGGLLASVMEIVDWWAKIPNIWSAWIVMVVLWVMWAVIFWRYWKGLDRHTAMTKTMRALMGGSILEMLVAGPTQAWFHHEDRCYCARGSYTGLVFGCTAIIWLFGPGVFLLYLREKQRRERVLGQAQGL